MRTAYDMWNSDDPYIRARVRGRAITNALYRILVAPGGFNQAFRDRIVAGDRAAWAVAVDPAGGYREPIK